jgi:hypothetical protein
MKMSKDNIVAFLAGICITIAAIVFIGTLSIQYEKEFRSIDTTKTIGYRDPNPPAPPVVDTFYPDDLVWHKYLKQAAIVTRVHRGDNQVSVIPVMVKNGEIIAIRQSAELVDYWTTALIFKTNKENFLLLNKLKKENNEK